MKVCAAEHFHFYKSFQSVHGIRSIKFLECDTKKSSSNAPSAKWELPFFLRIVCVESEKLK